MHLPCFPPVNLVMTNMGKPPKTNKLDPYYIMFLASSKFKLILTKSLNGVEQNEEKYGRERGNRRTKSGIMKKRKNDIKGSSQYLKI